MRIRHVIQELVKLQIVLETVSEKAEINIAVDEAVRQVQSQMSCEVASEVAGMLYGTFITSNPELCCAFMERLKHDLPAVFGQVCENFQTETLDTYA